MDVVVEDRETKDNVGVDVVVEDKRGKGRGTRVQTFWWKTEGQRMT